MAQIAPDQKFSLKIIKSGGDTLNLCIQCGTCTASCPSGRLTTLSIRTLYRMAQLGLENEVLFSDELWHCTTCYNCHERCPGGVQTVDVIFTLRNMAVQAGNMAKAHRIGAGYLLEYGHLVPINKTTREARKELGMSEFPSIAMADQNCRKEIQIILKATKFDKLAEVKK